MTNIKLNSMHVNYPCCHSISIGLKLSTPSFNNFCSGLQVLEDLANQVLKSSGGGVFKFLRGYHES